MKLSCPCCKFRGFVKGRHGVGIWICVVLFFSVGLLLLLSKHTYTCRNCGFRWRA